MASGLVNTSRQVGGPIGLAVVVTVIGLATQGLGIGATPNQIIMAFQYAFLASASFGALAVVASLVLRDVRVPVRSSPILPQIK
jgi:hypothetical protein